MIDDAIKLRARLAACATEFRIASQLSLTRGAKRLANEDAKACDDAAAMLQKLGTEVTRLRLGIQCHLDTGDPNRAVLRQMTETWNGDRAA